MRLDVYRNTSGLTMERLALLLGVPYNTMLTWFYRRPPNDTSKQLIAARTGGAVGVQDWPTEGGCTPRRLRRAKKRKP